MKELRARLAKARELLQKVRADPTEEAYSWLGDPELDELLSLIEDLERFFARANLVISRPEVRNEFGEKKP